MLTLLPYPFKSLFNAEQYKARQDKSANYIPNTEDKNSNYTILKNESPRWPLGTCTKSMKEIKIPFRKT